MNTKKKTNTKLTNEVIDNRLLKSNRPITRIGSVVNSATKIKWKCTTCNHEWDTTPNSVLNLNSGCPHCAGNTKLTESDIDDRIDGRGIVRVGSYVNYDTPIKWQCTNCFHAWNASPNNVLHGTGCPICSEWIKGQVKSLGQYDRVIATLSDKQLALQSPYTRVMDKHTVECLTCGHKWEVRLNDIVNNDNSCPSCAGLVKLTNEVVDQRLNDRHIVRVGDVINATTKIEWKCQYNHSWYATPDSVLNLQSGCPVCGRVGFASHLYFKRNPHKRDINGMLYFIEGEYNNKHFIKIGITEKTVARRFAGDIKKYQIREIATRSATLYEAYLLEQEILHKYIDRLFQPSGDFDGKTECLQYDPKIIEDILQNYFTPLP